MVQIDNLQDPFLSLIDVISKFSSVYSQVT